MIFLLCGVVVAVAVVFAELPINRAVVFAELPINRAVYTRENKPRLTLAAAYVIRKRNYLYEYGLPG